MLINVTAKGAAVGGLVFSCPQLRYLLFALLAISCAVLTGCVPLRHSTECRSFYDLTPQQREAKVRASSEKDQLVLYFCGMYHEPPTDFSNVIADRGVEVIPALLEKLKTEDSETRKDLILHIFEQIAERGYMQGNREVLEQLRNVVNTMKDNGIKDSSQQRLRTIEEKI